MTTSTPELLAEGFTMLESGRWHEGRLWVAHWASGEIVAIGMDGTTERVADAPPGYGWAFDWLPDGRLLTTGPGLTLADGTTYGHLADVAEHGWSEIVTTAGGDVYVNGFAFDLVGGGAPNPGVIAHVAPDGATRIVAGDLQFANGMVITPDGRTLLVSESFASRITAFDIAAGGTLTNRRVWADRVAPDGICIDAEGAVWCGAPGIRMLGGGPDAPGGALIRVREGGKITDRVEFDRPVFSCALGGPAGRTLFALASEWSGFENIDANAAARTGQVLTVEVEVPAAA
ncbi:sugar lactone lactonase YvrE [Actinoplanes octamycinicus]|uniref:Sugar lactone lactonase YvrE n=1 Tax=Actinoplanes octamycinicus TaxID=135948 RepID=A0A7W7M8Y7_9ACTN|nr:SMP-30/gluconolactonase/LRE family protein [Actinoplanes octamycinicus]MBB4741362.1 sugar lactone lactonase YvrE [Actinoplanes octamycinicus]GIE62839.1 gluconolaconase [Actinoplanes octamycinicus]